MWKWCGLTATALLAVVVIGLVNGGHTQNVWSHLAKVTGFTVKTVHITGQRYVSDDTILKYLSIRTEIPTALFDAQTARKNLESLPWVKSASVLRLYPSTLKIEIVERTPQALWQRGKLYTVIDAKGQPIVDVEGPQMAVLPLIEGRGANKRAAELLAIMAEFPGLRARVRAAELVSERRWNLHLHEGIRILLPEANMRQALRDLDEYQEKGGILAMQLNSIDLRLPDRVTLQMVDKAHASRKNLWKARTLVSGNARERS